MGPPPLTQSGRGEALEEVDPLDLMAGFFLRGAMAAVVVMVEARCEDVLFNSRQVRKSDTLLDCTVLSSTVQ